MLGHCAEVCEWQDSPLSSRSNADLVRWTATNRSDEEHAIAIQKKLAELQLNGSINTNIDEKTVDKDSKKNTGREESAIIDGGIRPSGIYAQGELITKDPVIGLDEAHESYVILVDSRGSTYELKLEE